ncbi:hypothetical protein SLEP1_g35101 [Rubroshorea leprosula]|uniref:Disease resistance protein winged helix domain-containing protein n=1 Tax=Rubroshorea leprosula TaxID=152421 RepID=A0AAV5KMJ0_9ROSI|nr:hypothetical protein SLEP1_g35101 [Rubroshorea leprosula]
MENFVGPILEVVKFVGDPAVRYLKYQIKFNDYLEEYKIGKEDLCLRERHIRSRLDTDLQRPWNVANEEVEKWLEDVEEFIAKQDVEDEVNNHGCLSCCCRVKILEERTQQLKEIYDRGDAYTNECLVVEDQSRKLDVYSQLGYGKIAKEEVKKWLKNVEEITGRVANDIENQINRSQSLSNASACLANLLNEKIQEMKRMYEGGRLTGSLVVDDPSASAVELPTSELQGSRDVKAEIWACLMGDTVAKEIVNECDGLPLAIITVAGSLKEISEPRLWKAALNQLRECRRNVAGTDDDAFRILKFSYDRLRNPKIQHCFLYCAMYPEDYNIQRKEIIEYWIDEGFIDEMETWQAMKDEGYDILRKLEDNCLLEDGEEEDCVRMHDLVRDMALNVTRTNPQFLVKAGLRLKKLPEKGEWTENLEKVSLMRNFIKEIPSNIPSSKCTMLTTLLLSHNNLLTIPESIFEYMPQLKILDLSYNQEFSSLPDSLSKLVNLTTLLLQATSLIEVPSLSNLQALKKLDLGRSGLEEIPKGLEMLTNLKYLDISGNRILEFSPEVDEIANGILSNLSELQYLVIEEMEMSSICTLLMLQAISLLNLIIVLLWN